MFKMFSKHKGGAEAGEAKAVDLPRPKEILEPIGRTLVMEHGQDPDWVWKLKCVLKPIEGDNNRHEFRVFDPIAAAKARVMVKNFETLGQQPELILYTGWIDKKSRAMELLDARVSQKAV